MTPDLIPLAIAVAASPFPVIPAILFLLTARPVATAGAFLAGWWSGIVAGTTASVVLSSVVQGFDEPPTWVAWARIVLGSALVVLGVRQWSTRAQRTEAPAWMRSLEDSTPSAAGRLGLLLSAANPKILLLSAAAGLSIAAADETAAWTAVTVVLFALLGSVSVAVPLVAHLALGDRARRPLEGARDWLTRNNATVMALVVLAIGLVLLTEGIAGL
ncbi:MAG TPA: GAP family protein [Ornithinibacter sp.]|nr:GAP family protein [Ornithinibacter sp.]